MTLTKKRPQNDFSFRGRSAVLFFFIRNLFCNLLAVAHQHCCDFRTGSVILRIQLTIGAIYDASTTCPLHSRDCICRNALRIGITEDIGILADRNIVLLVLRVAIQDRRELLAGYNIVRTELAVAVASNDAVRIRPRDCVRVVLARNDVSERCSSSARLVLQTVQNGYDHTARGAVVRAEGGLACRSSCPCRQHT